MGSAAELTLGWRVQMDTARSTKVFSFSGDREKLGGYVQALEDERRKIEAFKRELPLCMQLITDAVEALKEHMSEQQQSETSISILKLSCNSEDDSNDHRSCGKSLLEDFMTSKRKLDKSRTEEGEEHLAKKGCADVDLDKPSWMVQAQLWSQPKRLETLETAQQEKEAPKSNAVRPQAKHATAGIFLNSTQGSGGAFSPFVKTRNSEPQPVPTSNAHLTLSSGGDRESRHSGPHSPRADEVANGSSQQFNGCQSSVPVEATSTAGISQHVGQSSSSNRKSRRCWSPELHRRFVGALQQLGGSHVATPKQIREIMKVDGLTNDEVKSHLQKYRLHTRRPTATTQPATPHSAAQLVVLGGIWVPPDYAACRAPFSQDLYSHMRASAQLHQPNSSEEQDEASHSRSSPRQQQQQQCREDAAAAESSEGESVGDGAAGGDGGGNPGEDVVTTRNDEHHHHHHQRLHVLEDEDDGDVTEAEDSRCNEATAKDKKAPVDA